jgi:hypothetical protein
MPTRALNDVGSPGGFNFTGCSRSCRLNRCRASAPAAVVQIDTFGRRGNAQKCARMGIQGTLGGRQIAE